MPDDVLEQLRRYGEAVERQVLLGEAPRARRGRTLLAVAASVAVLAAGAVVAGALRDEDGGTRVATGPAPTGTAAPAEATGTVVFVRGTATWAGTRDPRGTLQVAACPVASGTPNCPDMRTTSVADDGRFVLPLPAGRADEWRVAAFVTTDAGCVFDCDWRSAVLGPSSTVTGAQPPQDLRLSVTARVVGLFVVDRDGNPFAGGGVHVNDVRCTEPCPGTDLAPMFMGASPRDGAVEVVVDPSAVYDVFGQATGTGWPGGTVVNGNTMWFSETTTVEGRDLPEGTVIRVDGGPA